MKFVATCWLLNLLHVHVACVHDNCRSSLDTETSAWSLAESFSGIYELERQERHDSATGSSLHSGWWEELQPWLRESEQAVTEESQSAEIDVISLESIPATGKSTLLSTLRASGHTVILEPMEELFSDYTPRVYGNLSRWFFTFQVEYMDWMAKVRGAVRAIKQQDPDKVIFVERSPRSQKKVFMELFGPLVSEWERSLLDRMWERMWWQPKRHVFLTIDPAVAIGRLTMRARVGEKVDANFIRKLHDLHKAAFDSKVDDRVVTVELQFGDSPAACVEKVAQALRTVGIGVET